MRDAVQPSEWQVRVSRRGAAFELRLVATKDTMRTNYYFTCANYLEIRSRKYEGARRPGRAVVHAKRCRRRWLRREGRDRLAPMPVGSRRRVAKATCFALLALIAELTGRSITARLDRAFHVAPLAAPSTPYYPFVLAGVRTLAALALTTVAWRLLRAHLTASCGERLLHAAGQRHSGAPRPHLRLTPRLWLASFGATSLWFLVQDDYERVSEGRWPLLAPWLHTYALPVFAVLAILLALGWSVVRDWVADVEHYAAAAFARVCRVLRACAVLTRRQHVPDDRAPRSLFGLIFESRPPPVAA